MPTQLKSALESERNRTERFIRLYARNQQALFSYVLALVPQWTDAVSVMEATHLVLWRRFEQYQQDQQEQQGTNFTDWATRGAKEEVLKYRQRRKKEWLCFSADVVSKLDRELRSMGDILQSQRECLPTCLAKLPERPRVLLYHRYQDNTSVQQVAGKMSCAVSTVRKSLQRIRHLLLDCNQKSFGEGATTLKRLSATQELEVETLCSALFDGTVSSDQFRLLQVYLRISASSRQLYIQHRNLHGALAAACVYEVLPTHSYKGMSSHDGLAPNHESSETKNSPSRPQDSSALATTQDSKQASISTTADASKSSRQDKWVHVGHKLMDMQAVATKHITATSLSTAGLVTVLALVIMATLTPPGRRLFERLATTEPVATGSIARLIRGQNCQWMDPDRAPEVGAELNDGQQLKLAKGLVEIKYRDGAQVILQGPVVFELSHLGHNYLNSGKLTAIIPKSAIGYTVETPNARVVDRGTEFAVEVRPDERSEVHVFRGSVDAQWLDKTGPVGESVRLTTGKAARFEFGDEHKSIPTFAANEARYRRTLDRVSTLALKKALWRKATKRLRMDPDLILYYTYAGNEAGQRKFANQATVANKKFPCVLAGSSGQIPGFASTRGRWPWTAALNFAGDRDKYLRVENLADSGGVLTRLGSAMSLVVTVGSLESVHGAPGDASDRTSKSANRLGRAILRGPILMNRRSHSKKVDFQLALLASVDRDHSERIEFRLNQTLESDSQADGEDARSTSGTLQIPQKSQSDTFAQNIVLSREVNLDQQPWHQIVVVCDQVSVRLYWDGSQVGEQLLDQPLILQLEALSIGHGIIVSPEGKIQEVGFAGLIDDLAVLKRPLQEAEIQYMADLY
jgi:RNA polymerase sigma factor (sigma-70 family)